MAEPNQTEVRTKATSYLAPFIDSRQSIILAVLDEEDRFLRIEEGILIKTGRIDRVYLWDYNGVLMDRKDGLKTTFQHPREVIEWFQKEYAPAAADVPADKIDLKKIGARPQSILIMLDVMYHMQDARETGHSNPGLTRVIKSAQNDLIKHQRNLVLVGNRDFVPPELEHHVSVVKYPLPDREYLHSVVQIGKRWFAPKGQAQDSTKWLQMTLDEELEIATLLLGFRGWEAENVLARSAYENISQRSVDSSIPAGFDIETIRNAKVETIRNNPALNIVIPKFGKDKEAGLDMVGGANALKEWFLDQKQLFGEEARQEGIKMPKGAVMFGPAGTGKDWAVENLASTIGWTTLYADLGASKGPLQGQSHKGYREIISAAEAQSPCFLVLSEWEKTMAAAFAGPGVGGINSTDSEIFASFLNWMQRRTAPVFVWALTNDISQIPDSALRAGRWDQIWFMDLPREWERKEIFAIHLRSTGWDAETYKIDIDVLASMTESYTGSEIADIVNKAIILKYTRQGPRSQNVVLTTDHLLRTIKATPSGFSRKGDEIKSLREYALKGNFSTANGEMKTSQDSQRILPVKIGNSLVEGLSAAAQLKN